MDKDSSVRIVVFASCPVLPKCVFFGHISKAAQSGIAIASGSLAVHTTSKTLQIDVVSLQVFCCVTASLRYSIPGVMVNEVLLEKT